jgi:sugar phosphate isomerase/epimerase
MPRITRREWHRLVAGGALGALAWPGSAAADAALSPRTRRPQPPGGQRIDSRVRGVQIGVQSYSFRDRPLDACIEAVASAGIGSCELWQGHLEPRGAGREALRDWRLKTPLGFFERVRADFERAGVALNGYNLSFRDDFSEAEIARGFEMAAALGAPVMTASASQQVVPRVAAVAGRFEIKVGLHNHSKVDPGEFATPGDFERAMAVSPWIGVNLDIGHFTAANFDAVDFLDRHHDRIVTLHVKDRGRDQGPAVPFGEGAAPIKEVLARLRDRRWDIPANIEYEYRGGDSVEAVRACLDYCRKALE